MVGMSSAFDFCNKIRVFVTLSDFGENLAKVWQSPKNSDLIARGERATLSDRFELSYTSLGPKLTEIGFLFVCLLSSAFLQSFHYCSFRNDFDLIFQVFSGHFQLNFLKFTLFVKLFSSLFKIFFVCLFVKLFSSFLPPSRQTNDNFGNFFFKFSKSW